jgi:penicillin-binding protein
LEKKKKTSGKQIAFEIVKYTLISFKWIFILFMLTGILGGAAGAGYVASLVKDEPIRTKEAMMTKISENVITGFAYFEDDNPIGQLRTEEDRRMAALEEIPQTLLDAVLAIEDKNFYEHSGIDFKATLRAVYQKMLKKDVQTGGSTITQQLARRVFLTLDKEDGRKARELFLALRMERLMSKDEILLAYLNKIPYGNGSSGYNLYGVKAAAKGIFNIDDLKELNIAQSAYLAGLPQLPSYYSAFTSKGEVDAAALKRATTRQQLVLRRMLEEGKIDQTQYQDALAFDLKASLAQPLKKAYSTYPYLMIEVEKEAVKALLKVQQPKLDAQSNPARYSEETKNVLAQMLSGGYQIYTTIDKGIYDGMRVIADNKDNFTPDDKTKGVEQIGGIILNNKTGAILGMMEGRDFFTEQLNHATQAYRQPGSTMKPIAAFLPAIDKGAIGPASIIDDVPIILKDGTKVGYHIPENWDDEYHGLITARKALNQSYNIPAIKLFLNTVGINDAWGFAKKLGITTIVKEDYVAQTGVIGGLRYGVSVKELTGAYASIANNGVFNEPFMIRKITDADGKVIYEHEQKPTYVFSEQTAYLMTDMLRTVITAGTATDLPGKFKSYGKIPIVGKTGSTQDDADAWFMGYSPDITAGVWAGYDSPVYKLSKASGGTNRAKNIWAMIMNTAVEQRPDLFPTKEFKRPEGIVEMTVSSLSGKLPSEAITKANKLNTDLFNKNFIPTEEDNVLTKLPIIEYKGINYIAQPGTPSDFVKERTVVKREQSISTLLKEIEGIMEKLPPDRKRPLSMYYPADYENDAPSETDPRTDDGKTPAPPTNVRASRYGNDNWVTFDESASPDVVGYRLYVSANRGNFSLLNGKVVIAGDATQFMETRTAGGIYGYYVTAVDVAGHESVPSKAAYTDGTSVDPLFLTPGDMTANSTGNSANIVNSNNSANSGKPDSASGSNNAKPPTPGSNAGTNPGAPTGTNGASNGPPPQVTKTAPSAPSSLTVTKNGDGIQMKWKAALPEEGVKQYNIYFSDKPNGKPVKLGSVSGAAEFNYYAVSYDGYYTVTAVNPNGESKPSSAVNYKK